jgi:uncharacterized membrane protein
MQQPRTAWRVSWARCDSPSSNWVLTCSTGCDYDFSAIGDEWPASAQPSAVTLDAGASAAVDVSVTVPSNALCVDNDSATVTLTSREDVTASGSSTVTTGANAVSALTAVPSTGTGSADPGSDAVYMLWLTNIGNCTDTFTIAAVGDTWTASALPTEVELDPGQATPVQVTVAVPPSAQCGSDVAIVTFTSNDGTASASSTLTTSAGAVRGVTVEPPSEALSGNPGDPVVYSLSVTNDGNCADTFTFAASGNAWTTSAPSVGPLGPGASTNVDVSFSGVYTDTEADILTIRWDLSDGSPPIHGTDTFNHAFAAAGDYTVTLTVTDDDGGVGTDSAIVSVRLRVYLPLVFRSSGP